MGFAWPTVRHSMPFDSPPPAGSRPIATFDVTRHCLLRCAPCYFYAAPSPEELPDEVFLSRAAVLRAQHGIRSAFWVGGEPLLRPGLVRRGIDLFERNCVATSGLMPIPSAWPTGWLVSLDGARAHHELLRGSGTFAVTMRSLKALPRARAVLSTTLTTPTVGAIDDLPQLVDESRAAGVVVGFHTGPAGDPLRVDGARRDEAVDQLLKLASCHPGVVLMPAPAIEALRPYATTAQPPCIYESRAVAFDPALEVKVPCTFGARANCDSCGCPVVALQRAWAAGDAASAAVLGSAFPRAA